MPLYIISNANNMQWHDAYYLVIWLIKTECQIRISLPAFYQISLFDFLLVVFHLLSVKMYPSQDYIHVKIHDVYPHRPKIQILRYRILHRF